MDSMEIEDDIYKSKNLSMRKLITQGTVLACRHTQHIKYN